MPGAHRDQKSVTDSQKLEIQEIVRHYVGARDQTESSQEKIVRMCLIAMLCLLIWRMNKKT